MSSLGLLETRTIAAGVRLADVMVKKAEVRLLRAQSICSGRFLLLVSGDTAAVGEAVAAARQSETRLHVWHILAQVSQPVLDMLGRSSGLAIQPGDSMAVIECRNVATGICAADAAIKAAGVRLAKMVCGQGINGKSYFILGGELTAVEAGVAAAVACAADGLLDQVIIAAPDPSTVATVTGGRL